LIPSRLQAQFLGQSGERIFVVMHRPAARADKCVLVVPPFAEEMNKSRRMITEFAQALTARGIAVACVDLYGTGDSDGDFAGARWGRWKSDIADAIQWCNSEAGPIVSLLGVRLGCMLAADALAAHGIRVQRSVFWQPTTDGARLVDQFLRIRVAASMQATSRETVAVLRERLRTGEPIEVAGYEISNELIEAIDRLRLHEIVGPELGALNWLEVSSAPAEQPSAPSARAVQQLRSAGRDVKLRCIPGQPFWATTEIVTLPELVQATVDAFCEAA
jgi:exosortase A-associated hydrolase 2